MRNNISSGIQPGTPILLPRTPRIYVRFISRVDKLYPRKISLLIKVDHQGEEIPIPVNPVRKVVGHDIYPTEHEPQNEQEVQNHKDRLKTFHDDIPPTSR